MVSPDHLDPQDRRDAQETPDGEATLENQYVADSSYFFFSKNKIWVSSIIYVIFICSIFLLILKRGRKYITLFRVYQDDPEQLDEPLELLGTQVVLELKESVVNQDLTADLW